MQRIGFRRLLPLVLTLAHAALLFYAVEHQDQAHASGPIPKRYVSIAYQENGVRWESRESRPLTIAQKLAVVLNLPALLLAIPLAATTFHGSDMGLLYAALPVVPIVWYGIGRWMDTTLGYIKQQRRLPRPLSGLLAIISTGLIVVSVMAVTPMNHPRMPDTSDTYWIGTALVIRSGLSLTMSLSSFCRRPS